MKTTLHDGSDVYELRRDAISVSSMLPRPDTSWHFFDAAGHDHRWCLTRSYGHPPAKSYNPIEGYVVPTIVWVKDGETWYEEDDEPTPIGHYECEECKEHIKPGYTTDTDERYIAGKLRCFINDKPVSREEFERRCPFLKNKP